MLRCLAIAWGWKPPEPEPPKKTYEQMLAEEGDLFKGLERWFPARKAAEGRR